MTVPKILKAFLALPEKCRTAQDKALIANMVRVLRKFRLHEYVPRDSKEWGRWVHKATASAKQEAKERWIADGRLEPRRPKEGWSRFSFPLNYNSDLLEVLLLVGKADACSTTTPVLHHWHETQLKKKKLHAIHQSDSVPHTVYMVHQRVPEHDKEKIKQAILSWDKRPEGKMILKIFNVSSFVEAKDSDYDVIRNYWK